MLKLERKEHPAKLERQFEVLVSFGNKQTEFFLCTVAKLIAFLQLPRELVPASQVDVQKCFLKGRQLL